MWQCSRQHENRDEAKFCGKCGEKRDTRPRCSACGATLAPEDVFCTSCGHPATTDAPEPVPAAAGAPPRVETAAPQATREEPVETKPEEPEPVTFSFGGATIEMKDPTKPEKVVKPATTRRGLSPAVTTILSFALMAGVLWLALYLITK